jgi:hypothetical protein
MDHLASAKNCFFRAHTTRRRAMKICVLSNRGPKGEETPCAFHLGGRRLCVVAVLESWSDATHRFFEVLVGDGRRFVIRLDPGSRSWELAAVFAASARKPAAKPVTPSEPRKFFSAIPALKLQRPKAG